MKRILLTVTAGAALMLGGLFTGTAQADHRHHRHRHHHHHGYGHFDHCYGGYGRGFGGYGLYGGYGGYRSIYGPGIYSPYSSFGYGRSYYRSPGFGLYLRF